MAVAGASAHGVVGGAGGEQVGGGTDARSLLISPRRRRCASSSRPRSTLPPGSAWLCSGRFAVLARAARHNAAWPVPRGLVARGRNDRRRQRRLRPAGRHRRAGPVRAGADRHRGARAGRPQPPRAVERAPRRSARPASPGRSPRSSCRRWRSRLSPASTRRGSSSATRTGTNFHLWWKSIVDARQRRLPRHAHVARIGARVRVRRHHHRRGRLAARVGLARTAATRRR